MRRKIVIDILYNYQLFILVLHPRFPLLSFYCLRAPLVVFFTRYLVPYYLHLYIYIYIYIYIYLAAHFIRFLYVFGLTEVRQGS